MTTHYCKDCKFYEPEYDHNIYIPAICKAIKNVDVVTGDVTYQYCDKMRAAGPKGIGSPCGPFAKLFEAKEGTPVPKVGLLASKEAQTAALLVTVVLTMLLILDAGGAFK